uniref:Coronin n=1 Tax=Anser cygnoides TaxID=8845 RepID=A0A8B9DGX1_ANSCY
MGMCPCPQHGAGPAGCPARRRIRHYGEEEARCSPLLNVATHPAGPGVLNPSLFSFYLNRTRSCGSLTPEPARLHPRASRDMRTTRTPGCSGWAPAIASSPWGSARYGPRWEGSSALAGISHPCQGHGTLSPRVSLAPAWAPARHGDRKARAPPGAFRAAWPPRQQAAREAGAPLPVPVGGRASGHLQSLQRPARSHIGSEWPRWVLPCLAQQPAALEPALSRRDTERGQAGTAPPLPARDCPRGLGHCVHSAVSPVVAEWLGTCRPEGEDVGTAVPPRCRAAPSAVSSSLQMREREVKLWDTRKFSGATFTLTLDTSPGAMIPLFDADTGLLVLGGKGENLLYCFEAAPAQPALTQVTQCLTEGRTRGLAAVPRLALDVMACEVLRVLQLTDTFLVPVSYIVPRKSVQEFHEDLFPDCAGVLPATGAQAWWAGDSQQVGKVSLHPARRPTQTFRSPVIAAATPSTQLPDDGPADTDRSDGSGYSSPSGSLASPSSAATSLSASTGPSSGFASSPSQKSLQSILGPSSRFRHAQGAVLHRDTHITNLRGLSLTTPGESDGFCANHERVALPLLSAGGQIAILELSKPGRLPDTAVPTIQNSAAVADLCWDPFDPRRLAVAGEDAKIRLWRVPEGGLQDTLREPEAVLQGHTEKIYSIRFHPVAADLLVSSSYDMTVRIWELGTRQEVLCLQGHTDQIFSLAWSPDGRQLATASKDGRLRLYEPRRSPQPQQEGPGPEGGRGARLVWVCGGDLLLVSGFDSRSERRILLYRARALPDGPLSVLGLDVAPSTLLPFYDEDTSVVFLTGKGDTRVFLYEVTPEPPYFLECNSFTSSDPHKGFVFLRKTACDVREVEFARALRLGQGALEPVAFRVPRVKKEYFQDDIFPPTRVWWEPSLSAGAWLAGADGQHRRADLRPADMTPVSQAPKEQPARKFVPAAVYLGEKTDEQKKEELLSAMVARLGSRHDPLPQDSFEGVDEAEWVGTAGMWGRWDMGTPGHCNVGTRGHRDVGTRGHCDTATWGHGDTT